MSIPIKSVGPKPARIMIVGEHPSVNDEQAGMPFQGQTGEELTKMLHEAGIARTECYITHVSKHRPQNTDSRFLFKDGFTKTMKGTGKMCLPTDQLAADLLTLEQEIREVKPNVIVAAGNMAHWALMRTASAKSGIADWRGSELKLPEYFKHDAVVIPIYAPSTIMKQWAWRNITVHDLRVRAKRYMDTTVLQVPDYRFIVRPTFDQAMTTLLGLYKRLDASPSPMRIAVDIETRMHLTACIGLAWSTTEAMCIPLLCVENVDGYWHSEAEAAIYLALSDVLTHPKCAVVGQNFAYDSQYFGRYHGFLPRVTDDTMMMQHVCFPGIQKGLDFLSSMYCNFHQFWKNEGKEWNPKYQPEEQLWAYNCKDAVITYEVANELDKVIDKLGFRKQYDFQMELWHHVLTMMLRGVAINRQTRSDLALELMNALCEREHQINYIAGFPLNPRSPAQMQKFFYEDMGFPKQYSRKTRNADGSRKVTTDEEALQAIIRKEPLLRDFVRLIVESRSLGVFLSTFVQARLGPDGRIRCYYNVAGAESLRYTSAEDAFGSGTNLQNLPRGNEEEIEITELVQYNLPNIRKLFIPDPGYEIGEVDLAGADAQVVAWDSDDEILKEIFRKNLKLHVENGKLMYGASMMGPDGKREPYYTRVKMGVHLTNYGGSAKTCAAALNITIHEAEKFQRRWFEIHPKILAWQERKQAELMRTRSVSNMFGYRRLYFDRIEGLLGEALAWTPQSTVACVTNRAIVNCNPLVTARMLQQEAAAIDFQERDLRNLRRHQLKELGFQLLLQVHDSLVFQYPIRNRHQILPVLQQALSVTVPYPDPLVIPWGLKLSDKSWGDAKDMKWPT